MWQKEATVLKKLYFILCLSTFCLILLGGFVRSMGAGLACPDWPLCFGQFVPSYEFKVYVELSHRVLAGLVSLIMVFCHIRLLRPSSPHGLRKTSTKTLCWVSFVLLALQIIMGGLTVLLKLHAHVVATHLALGTAFLSCLCWVYWNEFKTPPRSLLSTPKNNTKTLLYLPYVLLAAIYMQIILGGMVAAGGAALVCTDWPLCQGSFIPTLKGLVGLQVLHRLGAYTVFILSLVFFVWAKRQKIKFISSWAHGIVALVGVQICVGIVNIKLFIPPALAILHLALATCIVLCILYVIHSLRCCNKPL